MINEIPTISIYTITVGNLLNIMFALPNINSFDNLKFSTYKKKICYL